LVFVAGFFFCGCGFDFVVVDFLAFALFSGWWASFAHNCVPNGAARAMSAIMDVMIRGFMGFLVWGWRGYCG
jgi:hypothetical protein